MRIDLADRLQQLAGASCTTVAPVDYEEPGKDAIYAVGTAIVFAVELVGNVIASCEMSATTGDLRFRFERDIELEVFNFTAFEIWELVFPDGSGELSNYALA